MDIALKKCPSCCSVVLRYMSIPHNCRVLCTSPGKWNGVSIEKDEEFYFMGVCGEGVTLWSNSYECAFVIPHDDFNRRFLVNDLVVVCISPIWDIEQGEILRMIDYRPGLTQCGIVLQRKKEEKYVATQEILDKHFTIKTLD